MERTEPDQVSSGISWTEPGWVTENPNRTERLGWVGGQTGPGGSRTRTWVGRQARGRLNAGTGNGQSGGHAGANRANGCEHGHGARPTVPDSGSRRRPLRWLLDRSGSTAGRMLKTLGPTAKDDGAPVGQNFSQKVAQPATENGTAVLGEEGADRKLLAWGSCWWWRRSRRRGDGGGSIAGKSAARREKMRENEKERERKRGKERERKKKKKCCTRHERCDSNVTRGPKLN